MRRRSMLALIDATTSDPGGMETDPNAHTIFAGFSDDLTEVNLDLAGALESALEAESLIAPPSGPVPRDSARGVKLPHTVDQRVLGSGRVDDLPVDDFLVEEEFSILGPADEDLPMLDSREFIAAPRTDDLSIPGRGQSALVSKDAIQPMPVIVGTPIIAMHAEKRALPQNGVLQWGSAIAFWAATMLCAWTLRMEFFELIGL